METVCITIIHKVYNVEVGERCKRFRKFLDFRNNISVEKWSRNTHLLSVSKELVPVTPTSQKMHLDIFPCYWVLSPIGSSSSSVSSPVIIIVVFRDLKQTKMATASKAWRNKIINEQNMGTTFGVFLCTELEGKFFLFLSGTEHCFPLYTVNSSRHTRNLSSFFTRRFLRPRRRDWLRSLILTTIIIIITIWC